MLWIQWIWHSCKLCSSEKFRFQRPYSAAVKLNFFYVIFPSQFSIFLNSWFSETMWVVGYITMKWIWAQQSQLFKIPLVAGPTIYFHSFFENNMNLLVDAVQIIIIIFFKGIMIFVRYAYYFLQLNFSYLKKRKTKTLHSSLAKLQ